MATTIPKNRAGFLLAEVSRATAGELVAAASPRPIAGLVTDSRRVEADNLYVALRGEHHDGHRFVGEAFARGASAALVQDRSALPPGRAGVVVPDTLFALGTLAALHRERWGGRLVAITGSAGKTTTKDLTFAALRAAGMRVARTEGNLNNLIGAPMTLLALDEQVDAAVIEIGTSAPGEIARLAAICRPEVGVVTSVSAAHTAGLGSIEQVAREKAALLWALPETGAAIYRAEDAEIAAHLAAVRALRRLRFGSATDAEVRLVEHVLGPAPDMRCEFHVAADDLTLTSRLRLFGLGPALDAAAAIAVALALLGRGALSAAVQGIAGVSPAPGRLEPLAGPSGSLILDDSYNANPASMRISIETAIELARLRGGRALLVLGDMLELGDRSRFEHEAVGRQAAQSPVAALFACGVEMTAAAEMAREAGHEISVAHLSDPAFAAALVRPLLRQGDVVLIKGSLSMAMDRVASDLAGKEADR